MHIANEILRHKKLVARNINLEMFARAVQESVFHRTLLVASLSLNICLKFAIKCMVTKFATSQHC
jgi:hypothetical protein